MSGSVSESVSSGTMSAEQTAKVKVFVERIAAMPTDLGLRGLAVRAEPGQYPIPFNTA